MIFSLTASTINWEAINAISNIAVSTIAIVISVIAIWKTSKDANKLFEETNRAYISVYSDALIMNKRYYYLVLRNFGNTQAIINKFDVDKITRKSMLLNNKDFTKYIVGSTLAPGQSLTHLVMDDNMVHNHTTTIYIEYLSGNKTYHETFSFNLDSKSKLPSIGISTADYQKQFLELYQENIRRNL